jgi:hypothetical protein
MNQSGLDTVAAGASRYRIGWNTLAQSHMITDDLMGGEWCSLPDATGYLKPLKFRNPKAAREWLAACQKVWEGNCQSQERNPGM